MGGRPSHPRGRRRIRNRELSRSCRAFRGRSQGDDRLLSNRTTMRKAEVARRLRALVLLVVGTPLAVTASAQRTGASIDAGALSMQYADSIDANALALTPSIW